MKKISYVLGVLGVLFFLYAFIGRWVGAPTVFGYIHAFEAKTVVFGANSLMLMAILAALYGQDFKKKQE